MSPNILRISKHVKISYNEWYSKQSVKYIYKNRVLSSPGLLAKSNHYQSYIAINFPPPLSHKKMISLAPHLSQEHSLKLHASIAYYIFIKSHQLLLTIHLELYVMLNPSIKWFGFLLTDTGISPSFQKTSKFQSHLQSANILLYVSQSVIT